MRIAIFTILAYFLFLNCSFGRAIEGKHIDATVVAEQKIKSNRGYKDKVVITDIDNWKHPVKSVMDKNNIKIIKLELTIKKTYGTFYVHLPEIFIDNDRQFSDDLVKSIAKANGFWDFTLIDEDNKIKIVVYCNKKDKIVQKYSLNGTRTEILDYGKSQEEYKKYTSILDTKGNVTEIIKEDIDLDGNKELVITVDEYGAQFYVIRENGSKLQVLKESGSMGGYELYNIQLVKMKGNKQKYINAVRTNGAGLVGFSLYEVRNSNIVQIEYSASATGSGDDYLDSSTKNDIYDGYIQERSSYDVMNFQVSRYYKWNGKRFDFVSTNVDIGEYPDKPENIVSQFLKLNMLWDEDRNSIDVIKRINEINSSNKALDIDEISEFYQTKDSDSDWRFAVTYEDLQFKTLIRDTSATITVPVQSKQITFIISKNNDKWQITDIKGDFIKKISLQ